MGEIVLSSLDKDDDLSDRDTILEILNTFIDESKSAINFSMNDDRGEVAEDTPIFTEVEFFGKKIFARWSFEWSSYYGCSDMNGGDEETGSAEIWIRGRDVVLKEFEYLEKPSTLEEF